MGEQVITIGGAIEEKRNSIITVGGQDYDLEPIFGAIDKVVSAERQAVANPYSTNPLRMVLEARNVLVGALSRQVPPGLVPILRPIVKNAAGPMVEAARTAIKLRMESANRLMMKPTQSVPLTLDSGTYTAGASASASVLNPYLGSGGGMYNVNALWAITGFESGALADIKGQLITKLMIAGHDYVGASLGGIKSAVGLAANQGWGWYLFASDKRERAHTTVSPWNVQGAGGVVGSIMRETGQVDIAFRNGSAAAFSGVFHVHVKASLCGSPFKGDALAQTFVPFNRQLAASATLAQHLPSQFANAFRRIGEAAGTLDGLEPALDSVLSDQLFFPND